MTKLNMKKTANTKTNDHLPAFLKANGIANTPAPIFAFTFVKYIRDIFTLQAIKKL